MSSVRTGLTRCAAILLLFIAATMICTATAAAASGTNDNYGSMTKGNREQQIVFWEREVRNLRNSELHEAMSKLYAAQAALETARRREGFFYTKTQDKATIRQLDEHVKLALTEVNTIKSQEKMMLAKLKPLYGVLSTQLAQEQKTSISEAIATVQEMSYNNAWYSSLFNIGEAESLTDIIVGFLVQWLVGYVIMYPFAILYYALWVAPWSVYAYCSGMTDLVPAVAVYIVSVGVMCLPLVALVGGFYAIKMKYGDRIREALNEARRRDRRRFHQD